MTVRVDKQVMAADSRKIVSRGFRHHGGYPAG